MSLSVVILAAGKGTRMKSALPKVLHPIAGKPMVQHIIDTVTALGAQQINLVYGHGAEQLQSALAHNKVNWCHQAEQLGTGHAVQQAVPHVNDNDDVLVLVGDAPLIKQQTLRKLLDVKAQADIALLTVEAQDPTGMGRIIRENGNVTAIVEHKDATDAQRDIKEINTGIMVMSGADLKRWVSQLENNNAQQEYYLVDVIGMAAKEGKQIQTAKAQSEVEVEGVNNRVQLARLERAYQLEQAQRLMLEGATLADPARVDIRGNVSTGQDVFIDVNVIMEGKVTLGNNVVIGPNCLLIDCDIADNTRIEANSVVQEAKVAENCTVGPYARLRPGAVLGKGAKVGNFVEMKKSTLGEGSKANHFTYLGDTIVGKGVNIGAGTITCNYDGVNKSQTIIGDGAFIGSNSSLVAPVNIGNNATIGAGSTIAKDVPEENLAVARGKQILKSSWKRPTKK
ncbi:bifunctional UDP-N-acetylglucosamine diphosphorylase/glucosamine-1-phosphate N-acetyltransferase GlmU [Alteromonas sp. a30]|uniref:bifunctional UDP-N-acetylglucosamine diphosphorylase/glucosamine-1-phosphate N-acetyltransferase GlmU n=1 Tax=Alteromonas sp. a30 TaxID=2730917 RepID=UPI002280A4B6|nr:bifunctional UDP-N-acetylglucosamine diphosphorylase/glucosamine-1-phosphate N-acetyltransferase GlmU [Alteromonas sp. a30]MCY7294969.1 bifunctional UDP-N-acetylglucosamine diphosphorylase/glucosamine-1-phosphate N-acetyltransferase GlmU [Alteromonas sp. a30]